jgi:hypothetical protein
MPLRGDEVARERIGSDEWVVKFDSLAVIDHVWKFTAYKSTERRKKEENLFWSARVPGFAAMSRNDVPRSVLERVEAWIQGTVSKARLRHAPTPRGA